MGKFDVSKVPFSATFLVSVKKIRKKTVLYDLGVDIGWQIILS